jgi:8-oxo-dGTP pyrophosphatase MutT (NUDIX family)
VSDHVRAAGGVLRKRSGGRTRYAIVHRPRYDDWSFPKGKLVDGESHAQAAIREVEEETGLTCALERELPPVRYVDRHGRPKVVQYWLMRPTGGAFSPNREVDDLRWLRPSDALALLSYERDRDLLRSLDEST